MEEVVERRSGKKVVWGVLLIALGVVFLLDQFGALELHGIGRWWPAFVILLGVIRIATPETPRHVVSGIAFILWGLWFFACIEHWYGLNWTNGWPLVLVIVGFEAILMAMFGRSSKGDRHVI